MADPRTHASKPRRGPRCQHTGDHLARIRMGVRAADGRARPVARGRPEAERRPGVRRGSHARRVHGARAVRRDDGRCLTRSCARRRGIDLHSIPLHRNVSLMETIAAPLVSVIMPVWNGERYMAAAVDSVLSQTYRHLELLIVDDGSEDGSRRIAARYAEADRRVRP